MTIKEMSVGKKAVNAFGTESQMRVAIEELDNDKIYFAEPEKDDLFD